jgi:hypothetical protein
MPPEKVAFFTEGLLYRTPMMLATSFAQRAAVKFLRDAPAGRVPVLFHLHLDPVYVCDHALFLEPLSNVPGEEEFLYVAYSAFTVRKVHPNAAPSWSKPIIIELDVTPDNTQVPEDVPLAEWH